jgi:hypothetical protein
MENTIVVIMGCTFDVRDVVVGDLIEKESDTACHTGSYYL